MDIIRFDGKYKKLETKEKYPNNENETIKDLVPFWQDHHFLAPNAFIRSSLFGVIKKGNRSFVKNETIASVNGLKITYTGEKLDQLDLDFYLSIIYLLKDEKLGKKHLLSASKILRTAGRTLSGSNTKLLHDSIKRLQGNSIEIKYSQYCYIGSLINEAYKDEKSHKWVIVLNEKLKELFFDHHYTHLDIKIRNKLKGKHFALWLYGFYLSHKEPFPMKIETLVKLSGSENTDKYDAKKAIVNAMDDLYLVLKEEKVKFDFVVKDNKLYVER